MFSDSPRFLMKKFIDIGGRAARSWCGTELSWVCKVMLGMPSHHYEPGTAGGQACMSPAWVGHS